MLLDMASLVNESHFTDSIHTDTYPVPEDLLSFMNSVTSETNKFLTEDPSWAMDFAPNGMFFRLGSEIFKLIPAGTLLGLGDTLMRKRYAKYGDLLCSLTDF
jgi:hypothetical protein